ncbi:MAG: histidine kinase [Burkholderiales bacterium]|nr:histidine kinase [Burkholderiales bacterium]
MTSVLPDPVRILVVEDSEDDYQLLLLQLRKAPFATIAVRVETEGELRTALRDAAWHVVISDHNLPRFSSAEALALVKQQSPGTPFIIMSGAIGEDAAVQAMQNGADDYVMKHRPGRLIPAIERGLRNSRERQIRRQAEEAMETANRRLASVTANMPGVLLRLTWDSATERLGLAYSSGGCFVLHTDSSPRAIHRIDDLLALFSPETVQNLRATVSAANRSSGRSLRWEGRTIGTNGVTWLLLAATRDAGSSAWDGMLTDISPEKEALEAAAALRRQTSELVAHQEAEKENERAAIAREIHDDIGGLLTGIKTDVVWLKKHLASDPGAQQKLADLGDLLEQVVGSTKRIAKALRPAILDQGLPAALEWQVREFQQRSGISCKFNSNADNLKLDPGSATGVFRVFQEALTNVSKHADARSVDVQLFSNDSNVTLEVRDDGQGLQEQDISKPESFGLRGMRERITQLGGWIEVNSSPGQGTTVMLSIPRKPDSGKGNS